MNFNDDTINVDHINTSLKFGDNKGLSKGITNQAKGSEIIVYRGVKCGLGRAHEKCQRYDDRTPEMLQMEIDEDKAFHDKHKWH